MPLQLTGLRWGFLFALGGMVVKEDTMNFSQLLPSIHTKIFVIVVI